MDVAVCHIRKSSQGGDMRRFFGCAVMVLLCLILCVNSVVASETAEATPYETLLEGATVLGVGCVTAYQVNDNTLIAIPEAMLGKLLVWHSEAVRLPTNAVSSNGVQMGADVQSGTTVVSLERRGSRIFMRNLTPGYAKRGGIDDAAESMVHSAQKRSIQISVDDATKGPIIAVLPVLAVGPQGEILADITQAFSTDIETFTARFHIVSTGLVPNSVDADRSYISQVKVFPHDLNIRTHLTFLATDPQNLAAGEQPISIEIGHSLNSIPEVPMPGRYFDKRVGYFRSRYTEYETSDGDVVSKKGVIIRFRLEKVHPEQRISETVKPIVFYIGQDVPKRWRQYIKAGVEEWQPVLEAAGFKNAIVAVNAPTPQEDPDWSAEDPRYNVVRWISQANANAMGPVIYDPRSGEILSAHIQVWPEVVEMFERYYYALASSLDPEATTLPLSEKKRGALLQYVIAHEVGHTLGLRHNHLASTAYTVKQMRDPSFANVHGPNASIMAYGRFNQCAQPGDGVTQIWPVIGPYDYFAIDWGYGIHGDTPKEERAALLKLADKSETDRRLTWGAAELPDEAEIWGADPRIQMENTGAERVQATRLAVANLLRSLDNLGAATGENDELFAATYHQMLNQQVAFIDSVASVVGGVMHTPNNTIPIKLPTVAEQRDAVRYLLGDASASFEPYKQRDIIYRAQTVGGVRAVESMQYAIVTKLLTGSRLAMLDAQHSINPDAYGVIDFANDISTALWADLDEVPRWRRAQQISYLDRVEEIIHATNSDVNRSQVVAALVAQGHSHPFAVMVAANGSNTLFPVWARTALPQLEKRLVSAATKSTNTLDKLYFADMAHRIQVILAE